MKRDIITGKKRWEADFSARARRSGERPTGMVGGPKPCSAEGRRVLPEGRVAGTCRQESSVRATVRSWVRTFGYASKWDHSAQGPVFKATNSIGEQSAASGRQLSYAEVGAAFARVVAALDKGTNPGVVSSEPFPTKDGACQESKGGCEA